LARRQRNKLASFRTADQSKNRIGRLYSLGPGSDAQIRQLNGSLLLRTRLKEYKTSCRGFDVNRMSSQYIGLLFHECRKRKQVQLTIGNDDQISFGCIFLDWK